MIQLVLTADGEYGFTVYCRTYDLEFSYFTDYEDIHFIISELEEEIKLRRKEYEKNKK